MLTKEPSNVAQASVLFLATNTAAFTSIFSLCPPYHLMFDFHVQVITSFVVSDISSCLSI